MNIQDILALARAGFSREEIAAIARGSENLTPAPEATPEPAPSPAPAPAPAPTGGQDNAQLQALLAQVGELTQTIRANAVIGSKQPPQETAEDIIAAIIAPPMKKGD